MRLASAIRIEAQITKGTAGAYSVRVTPKGGSPVTEAGTFTIAVPQPVAITPSSGPVKLPVVITGDDFGAAKGRVTIGGKTAKVTRWATDRIEVVTPKGLADGAQPVVVIGKSGTSTATLTYTVGSGGGSGEFMRVDVGSVHLEQTTRGTFFGATFNVSQNFLGVTISRSPNAVPSFGITINLPQLDTPKPFIVTPVPSTAGTLGVTYADGAGSVYQATLSDTFSLTVTSYAGGVLEGTFEGMLSKVAGSGAASVTATNGQVRAELDIVGQ